MYNKANNATQRATKSARRGGRTSETHGGFPWH
jgi:hypothetical protein